MKARPRTQPQSPQAHSFLPAHGAVLQRKCACGGAPGPTGDCPECAPKKKHSFQRKLMIGASNDPLEHEADRVADRVLAGPAYPAVKGTPLRIQRFTGQPTGAMDAAPASVDQVLSSPGRPLEPQLRQEMESRFGHDFSQVRLHSSAAAEHSAREVNAQAYTAGHNIVFGAGRFAPETREGRRLLAHELTHCVQQQTLMPRLQRKLVVDKDHPAAAPISAPASDPAASFSSATRFSMMDTLIQSLCDEFEVDGSGEVLSKARTSLNPADLAAGSKPTGCCCLNVLTEAGDTWTIEVSQFVSARTFFNSRQVVLNPPSTPLDAGAITAAGTVAFQGAVPTAGHELCGHAAIHELGAHPPTQDRTMTDVHDPTVRIENLISTEQGVPAAELRGLAASGPHRGESVDRVTIRDYPLNTSDVPTSEQNRIDFAAAYIVANKTFVDILGHSDNAGSSTAKQKVSNQRALKAKKALRDAGVPEKITKFNLTNVNRFTRVEGLSDTQPPPPPLAANQADWRRVDILMAGFPAGAQRPPAGTPTTVTPHTRNPNVPALKASTDPCVSLLVGGAYP